MNKEHDEAHLNIYIKSPLTDDNWELIVEKYIKPALEKFGKRRERGAENEIG
jgi:hypothetical protein